MLWHLEGTNVHLMASLHALKHDRHGLYPEAEEIYQAARRVTFEHNPLAPADQIFIENSSGNPLSSQIPQTLFSRVASEWERLGLPADRLEQFQPWVVAMNIGMMGAKERGMSTEHGVDPVLWSRSEHDGKQRTTLEEQADALTVFSSFPDNEKVSFLEYAASSSTSFLNDFDMMVQAWHDHDDQVFERILSHRRKICPDGFDRLCSGRNRVWLPKITQLAADQIPTLVLVGALHCVGESGLPTLLEKQGAKVLRVI